MCVPGVYSEYRVPFLAWLTYLYRGRLRGRSGQLRWSQVVVRLRVVCGVGVALVGGGFWRWVGGGSFNVSKAPKAPQALKACDAWCAARRTLHALQISKLHS